MYTNVNYKTKKALKDAVAKGETVTVFAPGYGQPPENGTCAVEGAALSRSAYLVCGSYDCERQSYQGSITTSATLPTCYVSRC